MGKVIYSINFSDGSKYIGCTKNIKKRSKEHKFDAAKGSKLKVHEAMRNLEFNFEIIEKCENEGVTFEREIFFIDKYRKEKCKLLNMTGGGLGCKGRTGKKHPMYGKHHSEESKNKMSESSKGENSPLYGKKLTEEHRRKMSETAKKRKKEKHPMYGRSHSFETKIKMSEIKKGEKHPGSRNKNWYKINHVLRGGFKKSCEKKDWDFNRFEEVFSGEYYFTKKGIRHKKYYYFYKGDSMEKIVDGKRYKEVEEIEECSCVGCALEGNCWIMDSQECFVKGIILEKIEGENYE